MKKEATDTIHPEVENLKRIYRVVKKAYTECSPQNFEEILKSHFKSDNVGELRMVLNVLNEIKGSYALLNIFLGKVVFGKDNRETQKNENNVIAKQYFDLFREKIEGKIGKIS